MKDLETLVLVLAGGEGSRLWPLTSTRSKPAVPIGGKYRLIDIPLSNAARSGLKKYLILTQGKDKSLFRHIKNTWTSQRIYDIWVDVLSPQELDSKYEGDAHAVKTVLSDIAMYEPRPDRVLVVPGDHLLKMNYQTFLDYAKAKDADAAVAIIPRPMTDALHLGSVGLDGDEIVEFREKDKDTPLRTNDDREMFYASMGIYCFKTDTLFEVLSDTSIMFGKDVLPALVRKKGRRVIGYDYSKFNAIPEKIRIISDGIPTEMLVDKSPDSDYWEDVGTIPAYFKANMDLLGVRPQFNLYGERWPIDTLNEPYGPAKLFGSTNIENLLVSAGTILNHVNGRNVVLSPRIQIENSRLENVIAFNDSWISNSNIKNTIIDKRVHLVNVEIGFDETSDRERGITVHESGLRVVPKFYEISGNR